MNSNTTRTENSGDALKDGKKQQKTVMYILSYSDGLNSTEDIAQMIGEEVYYVNLVAKLLEEKKLIKRT
jgi:aminopeptidase-like protein